MSKKIWLVVQECDVASDTSQKPTHEMRKVSQEEINVNQAREAYSIRVKCPWPKRKKREARQQESPYPHRRTWVQLDNPLVPSLLILRFMSLPGSENRQLWCSIAALPCDNSLMQGSQTRSLHTVTQN